MPFPNPATQFRPGQSGNPSGRPKKPLTDRTREKLDDPEVLDEIVDALIVAAATGDVAAQRLLWERIEGKLTDHVEHEGELKIVLEYVNAPDPAHFSPPETG